MTLSTGGFSRFVTSTSAPIATGWNESCRAGFAPAERPCLCTAHKIGYVILCPGAEEVLISTLKEAFTTSGAEDTKTKFLTALSAVEPKVKETLDSSEKRRHP
jgi:hypothetical protein